MGSIFLAMLAILTPTYSTFHSIEQLATLPAGWVVYVPTKRRRAPHAIRRWKRLAAIPG